MKLAILLLNYLSDEHTLECLKSLQKLQWSSPKKIFLVNNAANAKNFKQKITQSFPHVKFLQPHRNLGFTGGNNLAAKEAAKWGADLYLILNNDTKVDPQMVNHLSAPLKNAPNGIAVPKIYFYPGFEFHQDRYKKSQQGKVIWYAGGHIDWRNVMGIHEGVDQVDRGQYDKPKSVEFATGCAMLIKKEVIDRLGLFDDRYFLYLEDADFSQRALRLGYHISYAPKAILWHKNAESSGGSGSDLQDYFFTRNRLLFGSKYAPIKTKLALQKQAVKFIFSGRKWQKIGVRDFFIRKFGKGSYPLKDQ